MKKRFDANLEEIISCSLILKTYEFESFKKNKTLVYEIYSNEGIYILNNKTKNKTYIGQSKNLYKRVTKHLNGYGNGDFYIDYKHFKDDVEIYLILLETTEYENLNLLEKDFIDYFDCKNTGYNRINGKQQ